MSNRNFLVTWSMRIRSDSHEQAAVQAHDLICKVGSIATVYAVKDLDTGEQVYVDVENPANPIRFTRGS